MDSDRLEKSLGKRIFRTGAALGALACAGVVCASGLALRADLQETVPITIGSNLKIFTAEFEINRYVIPSIDDPVVRRVAVAAPRIQPYFAPEPVLVSAVVKEPGSDSTLSGDPEKSKASREILDVLQGRFQELAQDEYVPVDHAPSLPMIVTEPDLPAVSSIESEGAQRTSKRDQTAHAEVQEYGLDRSGLRQILRDAFMAKQETPKVVIHQVASVKPVAKTPLHPVVPSRVDFKKVANQIVGVPSAVAKVVTPAAKRESYAPARELLRPASVNAVNVQPKPLALLALNPVEAPLPTRVPVTKIPTDYSKAAPAAPKTQEVPGVGVVRELLPGEVDSQSQGARYAVTLNTQARERIAKKSEETASDTSMITMSDAGARTAALEAPEAAPLPIEVKALPEVAKGPVDTAPPGGSAEKPDLTNLQQFVLLEKLKSLVAPQGPAAPPSPAPPAGAPPPPTSPAPEVQPALQQSKTGARMFSQSVPHHFGGRIVEAFTGGNRPVVGATVQILGTKWTAQTDDYGRFTFTDLTVEGILPVHVSRSGYLPRRLELKQAGPTDHELVSENSVALGALAAQEKRNEAFGYLFGQLVSPVGEGLQGHKIQLNGPHTLTPVYLDDRGVPNPQLQMTSARGQFTFTNLPTGTYLMTVTDALGQERAPHLIHVSPGEGIVRKVSMGSKRWIRGRALNATAGAPLDGAQVQLLGSARTALSDGNGGFLLGPVYVDCASANYLQIDKAGLYRNRIDFACSGETATSDVMLYVFPGSYVDGLAIDAQSPLKPNSGLVLGHVSFRQPTKVQLWGPEELDASPAPRGKDFYFDRDGILNPTRERTSNNGNFAILDTPEGLSYVQTFGKSDRTLSYWPVYTSASTVNVYSQ